MCGIAGLYSLRRQAVPAWCLKNMCEVMSHRGPDDEGYVFFHVQDEAFRDEGYWIEKGADLPTVHSDEEWRRFFDGNGKFNLALGHRRLAVIDLSSSGHQPMSNRTNGIWVTYNGEIYNYRDLRHDLECQGHRFFSQSDTEVIIHLYEQYGTDAIRRLNGVFAFALWDGRKNCLILARDRYGAKPLYYTIHDGLMSFASEIKGLLQVDGVKARLSYRALCDYFTFQNTFGEETLFEGIHLLEAGNFLVIEGHNLHKYQYWDFNFHESKDAGEKHFITNLKDFFARAVERQLMADVTVGSFLSGGLDSGSITAYASRNVPRLMTFTGGFDVAAAVSIENFFDERKKAELMSRTFGTEHYQMVIHAGDLEWALPHVVWHTEDLRVGMSYPHYYISQLAGKFVKVVLAGAGGDEILGGYPWRYALVKEGMTPNEFEQATYQYWSRLVPDKHKTAFFSPEMNRSFGGYSAIESLRSVIKCNSADTVLKKALYFDAKTFLHGILVIEDKLSMAHSLESRVPFLDHELVDFAVGIPSRYLVNDTWTEAAREDINLSGKYIFRKAMTDILPPEIIANRKQGFSAPDQSWYMRQLVEYIKSIVLSERCLDRGYFQREYIERVMEDHISGRVNYRLLIWSLLSFEWWNRIFIDGEIIEKQQVQIDRCRRERISRDAVANRAPESCYH